MSGDTNQGADSVELEDLFDSIAATQPAPAPAAASAPASASAPAEGDTDELEALFDRIATSEPQAAATPAATPDASEADGHDPQACPANKVINSVGHLTRQLHDTLAELGYDRQLQELSAAALPDARQRIDYVAKLTEQAASRSLNAVEAATPLQESLGAEAQSLAVQWDLVFTGAADVSQFKTLAQATRDYLRAVPERTDATRGHLREVMMAQEFQDLTGQVLKRINDLANNLETQLLQLLVENATPPIRNTEALGLLNGPAINGGSPDVVANQGQVDELLESLGF